MRALVRSLVLVLPLAFVGCGGGNDGSPTAPSATPSTPTRIITVSGSLAFGDVPVGSQRDLSFTIGNAGTAPLTVSGMSVSGGLASHTTASWTSGTIAPGGSQTVTVRFAPTSAGSYGGILTVNGDQTSGSNTVAISGTASGASVAGTWSGQYRVGTCNGTGSNQDYFCSSNRGAFPPGSVLPIALSLTQSGSSVSGTISFGQVTGVVTGSINAAGNLVLQGTATGGQVSVSLSSWLTTVSGTSMTGAFTYNAGLNGVPGVAVVTSTLSGVTRR
ncbi:MAG: choice-of-anchor D domain-containing protein [Vicinamibacterales bacterium]